MQTHRPKRLPRGVDSYNTVRLLGIAELYLNSLSMNQL